MTPGTFPEMDEYRARFYFIPKELKMLIDVAFVLAVTAFLKEQLGLSGKKVLLAAFLAVLFVMYVPLVTAMFPVVAPWLDQFVQAVMLFMTAAGSFDLVANLGSKIRNSSAG